MTSLEKHDLEIKNIIIRIEKAYNNKSWHCATDLTKYLLRLLKDRNEYCRLKKQSKNIFVENDVKFKKG